MEPSEHAIMFILNDAGGMMTSERTRREVWIELLDIDRACRYYEKVHARATLSHFLMRLGILISVAGGVTAILDLIPLRGVVKTMRGW